MPTSDKPQLPVLDLDLLRTIVAIADTGNFSGAAEAVFRTPSAVSMQVKRAEELLGRTLFNRDSRSVTATADGELLLQHSRRMLALNREMVSQFVKPDVVGVVRLGAPDDMAERALPDLLRRFAETHCGVTVDVVVETSSRLIKKIKNRELDLAVVTCDLPLQTSESIEIIFQERLTWAGARNGVAHEKIPLPISVWEEGCAWRNTGLKSLQEQNREYRIAFMSAHISGQRAAIMADLAIAPIPTSACIEGIVELGEQQGLPPLSNYALGMMLIEQPSKPVQAAADHLRASFASSEKTSLKQAACL